MNGSIRNMGTLRLKKFNAVFTIQGKKYCFSNIELKSGAYIVDGFKLSLELNHAVEFKLQAINGKKFNLDHVEYEFILPLRNFGKVVIPVSYTHLRAHET